MKRFLLILLGASYLWAIPPRAVVQSIYAIDTSDVTLLTAAVEKVFGSVRFSQEDALLSRSFLSGTLVNEIPSDKAASILKVFLEAVDNGADADEALDLAEIGFTTPLTAEQLKGFADARMRGRQLRVDPQIVDELLFECIIHEQTGAMFVPLVDGLHQGITEGIGADRLAVAFMIRLVQGDTKTVAAIIQEEIQLLKKMRNDDGRKMDALVDSVAFVGIDRSLLREVAIIAHEEAWSLGSHVAVVRGLAEAHKRGLTVEKFLIAVTIRIASESMFIPDPMVEEELQYVASLPDEQKRLTKFAAVVKAPKQDAVKVSKKAPPQRASLKELDDELLRLAMEKFLTARRPRNPASTQYLWAGVTRNGVDCSGFTMVCYREAGVTIPRVSRDQFAAFKKNKIALKDVRFGDLVFFSKHGPGTRITHVGIVHDHDANGNVRFIHSSGTPGVKIHTLKNNKYWNALYTGAVRVVN